jgi:UDP-N-acetylglucosamine 2-epimerase (non-hydrolysing)
MQKNTLVYGSVGIRNISFLMQTLKGQTNKWRNKMTKKIKLRVAIVLGTRPEIIKCSPIMKQLDKNKHYWKIIHTNQHYDSNMDRNFFDELDIPLSKILRLKHKFDLGKVISELNRLLLKGRYDVVLVQGDTNSVLAGAIAAKQLGIPVGHIEAGIRSYDRRMIEECNRQMVGRISSFNFCPNDSAVDNLEREGIPCKYNYITGNTIVDAVKLYSNFDTNWKDKLIDCDVRFALLTMHRAELVDNPILLTKMLCLINLISKKYNVKIIYPIHPRTRKMLSNFKININEEIDDLVLIEPTSFIETLSLEKNAEFVITDSGGIQEETCILKKKCLTIRDNTERQETLELNNTLIKPSEVDDYLTEKKQIILPESDYLVNPYGDGNASKNIIRILEKELLEKKCQIKKE